MKLPAHIWFAAGITAGFALIVTLIGLAIGARPGFPTERISIVLGFHAGLPLGLGIFCYLVTQLVLIAFGNNKRPAKQVARDLGHDLALLGLFVVVTYFHFNLKMWMPLINPSLYDEPYLAVDEKLRWLVDLLTYISAALRSGLLQEVRWYQVIFLTLFILSFAYFAAVRGQYYPRFAIGILLVLSLGGLSYLIAPAVGPFVFEDGSDPLATQSQRQMLSGFQSVQTAGMPWIIKNGSEYFTGALAAMPSLHLAHATVMTYYMIVSRSYLAPLFGFFWLWVLIDSIALRWHYIVDAPAGVLLAAFVIWLTDRMLRTPAPARAAPGPAAPVPVMPRGDSVPKAQDAARSP
ncbi:MAG: phosphatase PAP2 family protein [Kiloniellaceae bacterium]